MQTVIETWFHQGNDTALDANNPSVTDGFMKGKPYRVRVSDGNGYVLSETATTYVDTNPPVYQGTTLISGGTPPYFAPPQEVDTYNCDGLQTKQQCAGNANAQTTKIVYSYDSYGNINREDRYGNVNNAADTSLNQTTVRSFQPNVANWIVGLPAFESVYLGIGTGATNLIRHTDYYYDDLTACTAAPSYSQSNQTPTNGMLTGVVQWLNGGTKNPEVRMSYDTFGNLVCQSDGNGAITAIAYDSTNTFPTTVTNPLQQQSVISYYGVNSIPADTGTYGQVKSVADPNTINNPTTMTYDNSGRPQKQTLPDGTWTTKSYFNNSLVGSQNVRTATSTGLWDMAYFDGFGRTIKDLSSGFSQVVESDVSYYATGKQISLPYYMNGETQSYLYYLYDALGRLTQHENPDSSFTLSCYAAGVTVSIDANGHRRRELRDVYGRLTEVDEYLGKYSTCTTDPGSPYAKTQYGYDALGELLNVTDAMNNQTVMQYDTVGRKVYMSDPDMGKWTYYYDDKNRTMTQTDAKQQQVVFTYDLLNRLKNKHYPAGPDMVLTYDDPNSTNSIGRLSKMTDNSGQSVYNYDSVGRVTGIARTIGGQAYNPVQFAYVNGRLNQVTYPDSDYVSYKYDPTSGYLSNVLASDGVTSYVSYGGYDALGRPGAVSYGNGVAASYTYDPTTKRLYELTVNGLNNVSLLDNTYGYDYKGNVTSITDNLNKTLPTSLASDSYTLATGSAHAINSTGSGRQFQYDNNGNITNDGLRSYTYNFDNMPTAVNNIDFIYDGAGTRVQKVNPNTSTTTYFDGLYECTNGYCDKHIYANGNRIAIKTASQTFYHHGDHLGSTAVVTDMNGNQDESIAYYPFGGTRSDNSSVYLNYKYTGQELDGETGLYNYGARLYDPDLGRFLTPDSIVPKPWNPQSLNRYSYVQNNPVNHIDPTGHCEDDDDDCEEPEPAPAPAPAPSGSTGSGSFPVTTSSNWTSDATIGLTLNANYSSNYSFSSSIDTSSFGTPDGSYGMPYTNSFGGPLLSYGGFSGGGTSVSGNTGQSNSSISAGRGWGIGATLSGTSDIGAYAIGAGQNVAAGVGVFGNSLSGINAGGLASYGGFIGGPGHGLSYPAGKNNYALGGFAGGGLNVFVTNASQKSLLSGPFHVYSFNAGFFLRVLSLQLAVGDNGIWMFSYGGPLGFPSGVGFGIDYSEYNTNTWVR
jgi:RHS repeat-associated protein